MEELGPRFRGDDEWLSPSYVCPDKLAGGSNDGLPASA